MLRRGDLLLTLIRFLSDTGRWMGRPELKRRINMEKIKCMIGETFNIGGMEFIRFPEKDGKTPVVMKDIAFQSEFGDDNNLHTSTVLQRMQKDILPKVIDAVGEENVLSFETDLTTLDGLKPYPNLESRISLVTLDFYRANAEVLGKYKHNDWWWLAMPESAEPNDNPYWTLCVAPSGCIDGNSYGYSNGARPFCILNSSIFES